jgi:hypothetical protein
MQPDLSFPAGNEQDDEPLYVCRAVIKVGYIPESSAARHEQLLALSTTWRLCLRSRGKVRHLRVLGEGVRSLFRAELALKRFLASISGRGFHRSPESLYRPQAVRCFIMSELAESGPSAASTCRPRSWRGGAFSTLEAKRIRLDC